MPRMGYDRKSKPNNGLRLSEVIGPLSRCARMSHRFNDVQGPSAILARSVQIPEYASSCLPSGKDRDELSLRSTKHLLASSMLSGTITSK